MKVQFIFVLVALTCGFASAQNDETTTNTTEVGSGRVLNGDPVEIANAPWIVSIERYGIHHCTGIIVAERWVLTSGYCVRVLRFVRQFYQVRSGTAQIGSGDTITGINLVVRHPSFNANTLEYNYALLQLKTAVKLDGSTMANSTLADLLDTISTSTDCYLYGWSDSGALSNIQLEPISQYSCWSRYLGFRTITSQMMCAGTGGADGACFPDDGAPLVCTINSQEKVFAILSFYNCGLVYLDIFSRILSVRRWIRNVSGA